LLATQITRCQGEYCPERTDCKRYQPDDRATRTHWLVYAPFDQERDGACLERLSYTRRPIAAEDA
jgi:hypothetical protein